MKTRAAVLTGPQRDFEVMELDLDDPKEREVQIRMVAAGLCHSDLHMIDGDLSGVRFPMVGGHEASGVVEKVGPAVTKVAPGDHVVCSFIPSCGSCRWCATGHQNLCDIGAGTLEGVLPDGTFRFHRDGVDYGSFCLLGAFSEFITVSEYSVVKVDEWLPLDKAVLVGCGVPTGWGTAVNSGGVRPGDITVIYGIGGLGTNAVQAAAMAGSKYIIAVDPVPFKRDNALRFGATHAFATADEAQQKVVELSWGQGADQALVLIGTMEEKTITDAFNVVGKAGTVVVTGIANPEKLTVHVSGSDLVFMQKTIRGSLFGECNPQYDIVKLLRMYDAGELKLDELITTTYTLDEINQGYQDLRDGKNIRGVVRFD